MDILIKLYTTYYNIFCELEISQYSHSCMFERLCRAVSLNKVLLSGEWVHHSEYASNQESPNCGPNQRIRTPAVRKTAYIYIIVVIVIFFP